MKTKSLLVATSIVSLFLVGAGCNQPTVDSQMKKNDEMTTEKSNTMTDKGKDEAMMKSVTTTTAMMAKDADEDRAAASGTMMEKGSYEAYASSKLAMAKDGKVILFFRATWCPTCKGVDADIRAHLSDIPAKVTILDVNYDTATALRQQYGVTYQHTFVEVDANGTLIKKWSGSPTLQSLLAEIK